MVYADHFWYQASWVPLIRGQVRDSGRGTRIRTANMEVDYPDFTVQDELSSVTLIIEGHKLYVHREVLAAWSPVFKAMFTRDFKEKEMSEIELPDKKMDDFVELLYCMYPPIKSVSDSNVHQLLPLAEEYQILEVKKKCEEFLLTKPGSIELLVTAQAYGLQNLLTKCIQHARYRTFAELQKDPFYQKLEQVNLIRILELRVLDLESSMEQNKKAASERELKLYGFLNDLATGYGYFCSECKSRRVNDTCFNCLKMFREKVKTKFEEAKAYRSSHPCY